MSRADLSIPRPSTISSRASAKLARLDPADYSTHGLKSGYLTETANRVTDQFSEHPAITTAQHGEVAGRRGCCDDPCPIGRRVGQPVRHLHNRRPFGRQPNFLLSLLGKAIRSIASGSDDCAFNTGRYPIPGTSVWQYACNVERPLAVFRRATSKQMSFVRGKT